MDLRQLTYFVAVAEELHFGRAAERLHIAQPPLSNAVKKLESELGAELFNRTSRSVSLTLAGQFLLPKARTLIADAKKIKEQVRLYGSHESGVVRLGFVGTATYRIMPEVLRIAAERLPHLAIQMQGEMVAPKIEQAILEDDIDLAIVRLPVRSSLIETTKLSSDKFVVAIPKNHPLSRETTPLTIDSLRGEAMVTYKSEATVTKVLDSAFVEERIKPSRTTRVEETSTFLSLVSAGIGIGILPEHSHPISNEAIIYRQILKLPPIGLALAWRRGKNLPVTDALKQIVQEATANIQGDASGQQGLH